MKNITIFGAWNSSAHAGLGNWCRRKILGESFLAVNKKEDSPKNLLIVSRRSKQPVPVGSLIELSLEIEGVGAEEVLKPNGHKTSIGTKQLTEKAQAELAEKVPYPEFAKHIQSYTEGYNYHHDDRRTVFGVYQHNEVFCIHYLSEKMTGVGFESQQILDFFDQEGNKVTRHDFIEGQLKLHEVTKGTEPYDLTSATMPRPGKD